ncbi:MAG: thioredoxin domain-containing protein [Cyclobacteriaceae bacterium]|nr:thioredoxin domain-containing protein [Cyclobacteriaceae bacterium]
MTEKSNRLIHESSPYLLQHAHNPVDWYPWGEEALERARKQDMPILLSIGYSSCHWCHVMERESFEKTDIANLMNNHFVCIKLDREERPDIDQVYMDAVQAMGIAGGWPLNVFLTPQQEPFYGGTYFPPQRWAHLLVNIAKAFRENREQLDQSAQKFREALNRSVVERYGLHQNSDIPPDLIHKAVAQLKSQFDHVEGGTAKAPKFPMPTIWNFLWHYFAQSKDQEVLDHLHLTLQKMAMGGIYDQIGGGFARYSVDDRWFAPHFEKMLYDNAQLVSVYALAYSQSGHSLYKDVVYQTIEFVDRELKSPDGAFYSALDADSEGVEGKFYTWPFNEFQEETGDEADFLIDYYRLTKEGNWEDGRNILFTVEQDEEFAQKHQLDLAWMRNTREIYRDKLREHRESRVRPGLDNKILCGWNGLMIKALSDAYAVFHESRFLELAIKCATFIEKNLRLPSHQLLRIPRTQKTVPAYLEDYSAIVQAYIGLYQATFNDKWLYSAQNLTSYCLDHFYDEGESLFYYTDNQDQLLIARKKEVFDNVIPASNSIMAQNLWILGTILQRQSYLELSRKMVGKISPLISTDPAFLSNWATVLSFQQGTTAEVVICGEDPLHHRIPLAAHFHPHKILMGSDTISDLPLLHNRMPDQGTSIFVCYNSTCQLPTENPKIAIEQLAY